MTIDLEFDGFMVDAHGVLKLPDAGVVVVTGDNGAGKSRIIEAIYYALWGKTLRGSSPWITDTDGYVACDTGNLNVFRQYQGGNKSMIAHLGQTNITCDTPTKTQQALAPLTGDPDIWRKTHVFSSSDAAMFSTATDGERKRLIESILNLEVFDAAYDELGAELKQATLELLQHERALAAANAHLGRVGDLLRILQPPTAPEPESPPEPHAEFVYGPVADVAAWKRHRDAAADRERQTLSQEVVAAQATAREQVRAADAALKKHERGYCPECGQNILATELQKTRDHLAWAKLHLTTADAQLQVAQEELVAARAQARLERTEWDRLLQNAAAFQEAQRAAAQEAASDARRHQEWAKRTQAAKAAHAVALRDYEATRKERQQSVDLAVDSVEEIEAALERAQRTQAEILEAREVCGIKGLRAHVLGVALDGAEQLANAWLSRMAPGARLRLVSEGSKIAMHVASPDGFGGDEGYKANSGGERRRVDIALLLALADVASNTNAFANLGTLRRALFMDEVFDSLDADGRAAVCDVIQELGRARLVLVITHHADLANLLTGQKYSVRNGDVSPLT